MTEISQPPQFSHYRPLLVEPPPIPLGVAVGGFFFPLLALWFSGLHMLGSVVFLGITFDFAHAVALFLIGNVVACIAGFVLFFPLLLLATVVFGAAQIVLWSLQSEETNTRLAAHVGAWTALLAAIPVGRTFGDPYRPEDLTLMYFLAGLATPLGQYAGAWSQWSPLEPPDSSRFWQFGLRQLLVLTIWIAVGLTALKLLGLLQGAMLIFLGVWSIYQWCTMKLIVWFCRWRSHRRWGTPPSWQ